MPVPRPLRFSLLIAAVALPAVLFAPTAAAEEIPPSADCDVSPFPANSYPTFMCRAVLACYYEGPLSTNCAIARIYEGTLGYFTNKINHLPEARWYQHGNVQDP